jgi:hypothetical protein
MANQNGALCAPPAAMKSPGQQSACGTGAKSELPGKPIQAEGAAGVNWRSIRATLAMRAAGFFLIQLVVVGRHLKVADIFRQRRNTADSCR